MFLRTIILTPRLRRSELETIQGTPAVAHAQATRTTAALRVRAHSATRRSATATAFATLNGAVAAKVVQATTARYGTRSTTFKHIKTLSNFAIAWSTVTHFFKMPPAIRCVRMPRVRLATEPRQESLRCIPNRACRAARTVCSKPLRCVTRLGTAPRSRCATLETTATTISLCFSARASRMWYQTLVRLRPVVALGCTPIRTHNHRTHTRRLQVAGCTAGGCQRAVLRGVCWLTRAIILCCSVF